MSIRIRERTGIRSNGANGESAFASFGINSYRYLALSLILVLSSCTHWRSSAPSELAERIEQACLSADGRGRLTFQQNRHLFNYESQWDAKKGQLGLALFVPLHGEETLQIHWDTEKMAPAHLSGPFAVRLEQALQAQEQERLGQAWHDFKQGMGFWLRAMANFKDVCRQDSNRTQWVCDQQLLIASNTGSDEIDFRAQVSETYYFQAKLSRFDEDGAKIISLFLYPNQFRGQPQPLVGIELFARQCHK